MSLSRFSCDFCNSEAFSAFNFLVCYFSNFSGFGLMLVVGEQCLLILFCSFFFFFFSLLLY